MDFEKDVEKVERRGLRLGRRRALVAVTAVAHTSRPKTPTAQKGTLGECQPAASSLGAPHRVP